MPGWARSWKPKPEVWQGGKSLYISLLKMIDSGWFGASGRPKAHGGATGTLVGHGPGLFETIIVIVSGE